MAYVTCHVQYVLLFLVLAINSTQSQIFIFTRSYSSRPFFRCSWLRVYIHVQTCSEASMWDVLITALIVPY